MLGADENENKPTGKGGKRKSGQPGKKTERSRKSGPKAEPLQSAPDIQDAGAEERLDEEVIVQEQMAQEQVAQEQMVQEQIDAEVSAPVAATEASPSAETPASIEVATTNTAPVSVQAVTNAYGDYSWKSLDLARTFFEQLAGVRSIDKAFQLQSDFAREAYDTFVAESRRIRELHGELAKQRLGRLEEFMARMTGLPR